MKNKKVCNKTRSPPASLLFKGQGTEHATVKWPILKHTTPQALTALKTIKSRLSLIVQVNVVLNRTVVVDSDRRFDNLCGGHLQSLSELYHVSWWYYTLVIDLIGQLRRDVIGRLSVKPWCYWPWRLVISNWCVSIRVLSQLNSRLLLVKLSAFHSFKNYRIYIKISMYGWKLCALPWCGVNTYLARCGSK